MQLLAVVKVLAGAAHVALGRGRGEGELAWLHDLTVGLRPVQKMFGQQLTELVRGLPGGLLAELRPVPPLALRRELRNIGMVVAAVADGIGIAMPGASVIETDVWKMYRPFYDDLIAGKLRGSYYSSALAGFVSQPGTPDLFGYASRVGLRALARLIGAQERELETLSAAAACGALSRFLSGLEQEGIVQEAVAAGQLLRFRLLLRDAAGLVVSSPGADPDLTRFVGQLAKHPGLGANPRIVKAIGAILRNPGQYLPQHDAFVSDAHELGLVIDVLAAAGAAPDAIRPRIQAWITGLLEECQEADHFMVLEAILRGSSYADYSMLEPFVPYSYIRTTYASAWRRVGRGGA